MIANRVTRVLQVHTRYRHPGGEDQVVAAEKQLLESAGISVQQLFFDNDDISEAVSFSADIRIAGNAVWSRKAERHVGAAIRSHRPQVMHVHNTFATASPSVYRAALRGGVSVVQTLHNYRFVCPAATAFRDGHECIDCVGRLIPWPAVQHACVRKSRSQSAVSATTLALHRALGTFSRGIDSYVALTKFQMNLMVNGGLPIEKLIVIPNFVEPDPGTGDGARSGVLFAGRLSVEKGIAQLIAAAERQPKTVRVAGQGPLAATVEEAVARGHVEYLGSLPSAGIFNELRRAIALVMPSIWFEGFPLTLVEAYASGTPVIANRIGSLAELVQEGVTGLLVEPGDSYQLANRLKWATDHPDEMRHMGANARALYEQRYRGPVHLSSLREAYESAARRHRLHAIE